MNAVLRSQPNDLRLRDCHTRLLVSMRVGRWTKLFGLLQWIEQQQGTIVFLRTHAADGSGTLHASFGVDDFDAERLRHALQRNDGFEGVRIETLHRRQRHRGFDAACA